MTSLSVIEKISTLCNQSAQHQSSFADVICVLIGQLGNWKMSQVSKIGLLIGLFIASARAEDANTTLARKHPISVEDFNELSFKFRVPSPPLGFSSRVRRQLTGGVFVYDTDTDDSSGSWGDWEIGSQCSRTCGGGVLVEQRSCMNADCTGPSKRYSSCNTQACPPGALDFRQEQCSKYDSKPFERRLFQWIPYLKAPRKCELNCMPKGERFYYRHEKKVSMAVCTVEKRCPF